MDWTFLLNHSLTFDPVTIILVIGILKLNSEIVEIKLNAARRETKLDAVNTRVDDLMNQLTREHQENIAILAKR